MTDHVIFIHTFLDEVGGADLPLHHLPLFVLAEDGDLHVRNFVVVEGLLVVGIEIGDVDIGVLDSFGLQDFRAQAELVTNQDVAVVDFVLAEVGQVVVVDVGRLAVREHLVGELIRHLHGLAENDGIGTDGIAPPYVVPFQIRRFAEFLVRQLRIRHACKGKECNG